MKLVEKLNGKLRKQITEKVSDNETLDITVTISNKEEDYSMSYKVKDEKELSTIAALLGKVNLFGADGVSFGPDDTFDAISSGTKRKWKMK